MKNKSKLTKKIHKVPAVAQSAKPHKKQVTTKKATPHKAMPAKPTPKHPAPKPTAKPSKSAPIHFKNPKGSTKPTAPVKQVVPPVKPVIAAKHVAPAKPVAVPPPAKPAAIPAKQLKVKGHKAPQIVVAERDEHLCREHGCENMATTKGFCRMDYIKNWKKIKRKEMILKEGKLNQYIEELVSKYPDKYMEIIRLDLVTEVNFNKVIHDLELDESLEDLEYDNDSIDSLIGSVKKGEEFEEGDF